MRTDSCIQHTCFFLAQLHSENMCVETTITAVGTSRLSAPAACWQLATYLFLDWLYLHLARPSAYDSV